MSSFNSVLITGASRGLGAALALRLAGPGVALALVARDATRLAGVAEACAAKGATLRSAALDVADTAALAAQVVAWDAALPFDAVVANAGASSGRGLDGAAEEFPAVLRLLAVNLSGAVASVGPLLPRFRARRAGHVVLISSLSALRGPADIAGYTASKAGLRAWGEALRPALAQDGVALTVVCPGFFESEMSARWTGPRWFALPLEAAAERVHRAMLRRARRCSFPWPMALLLRLLDLAPAALGDRAMATFRTSIKPEG